MKKIWINRLLLFWFLISGGEGVAEEQKLVSKLTPVLPVATIEPSVGFFVAVGFQVVVRVPEEGAMGFAILHNGATEVMLQTFDSIYEDDPSFKVVIDKAPSLLFAEVSDIDAVASAVADFEVVMPRRETFYGATEITVREPGGHLVTFAQFKVSEQ